MTIKFKKAKPLTDAEEAKIQKMIASDPDNPELTDEELANMKPFAEVFPALAESIKRSRGRPALEKPKQQISLRLDQDVIEKWKASGPGWQARINEVLKKGEGGVIPSSPLYRKLSAGKWLILIQFQAKYRKFREF